MKKIIIAALILFGAANASTAQTSQDPAVIQQAQVITNNVHQAVNLTQAQMVEIQAVNVQYVINMSHIQQAGTAASPERTVLVKNHKNEKYQAILTPAQYALYEAMPQ